MIVFFPVLVFLEISNPQDGINICGERKGKKEMMFGQLSIYQGQNCEQQDILEMRNVQTT